MLSTALLQLCDSWGHIMKTLSISTFLGLVVAIPVLFSMHLDVMGTGRSDLSKGEIGLVITLSVGLINLAGFAIAHFRKSGK